MDERKACNSGVLCGSRMLACVNQRRKRKGRVRGSNEIRMNAFWLVTIIEDRVLQETVCGE